MNNYARITITLSRTEYLNLVDSAKEERRPTRDHARFLLSRALGNVSNSVLAMSTNANSDVNPAKVHTSLLQFETINPVS